MKDDTGSMPMAMLITLVGMMLSALLVPMVLSQSQSTSTDVHRLRALGAAQAGLDVALGHIRAATDGGVGVLHDLPCDPLVGSVSGGGTARYKVTITYYDADPRGRSGSWLTSHDIACYSGGGADNTPAFALLTAKGTDVASGNIDTAAGRTLQGTYTFQLNNGNIAGGLIHVYKTATSTDLCLDAGSGSPAAGTNVRMQPCTEGSISQEFAYQSNLTLVLVQSIVPATRPLGMCLDAGSPQAAGKVVAFQPCASTTKPQQQWSINDTANFEGTADGSTLDGLCFNVQSPNVAGSFVILGASSAGKCYVAYDNQETFSPDAAVGAGAAGCSKTDPTYPCPQSPSGQLVDFNEFGRCLDVTNQDVTSTFLIAWPCKQAPNANNVLWNQKWALPITAGSVSGTGKITTTPSPTTYCLKSPLSTLAYQYVVVVACPSGSLPANLSWTVYGDTTVYSTSYRIVDSSGYCLQPNDPNASPADLFAYGQKISKIVVARCDGSTMQKWNAPPNILPAPPLKDIGER